LQDLVKHSLQDLVKYRVFYWAYQPEVTAIINKKNLTQLKHTFQG